MTPQSWTCAWCLHAFDVPGGTGPGPFESDVLPRTFCGPCWEWVEEMRTYREYQQRLQDAMDERQRTWNQSTKAES